MKVLVVCNNAYMRGNGVCTAVVSLVKRLREKGIEVRVMACENPDPKGYPHEYLTTSGGHQWYNWEEYCNLFMQRLWK